MCVTTVLEKKTINATSVLTLIKLALIKSYLLRNYIYIYFTERLLKEVWDFKPILVHFGSHVNVLLIILNKTQFLPQYFSYLEIFCIFSFRNSFVTSKQLGNLKFASTMLLWNLTHSLFCLLKMSFYLINIDKNLVLFSDKLGSSVS